MPKVLIATDWLAACAGCHMSLLDLDERLVELLHHITITSSPVTDLKVPPASGVTVGVLTGAVSNTHNAEVARRMRSRCQFLVAVGDCATFGGIVAARNLVGTELFREFREVSPKVWKGKVFVPDLNKVFSGTGTIKDQNTIVARGCLIAGIGCKSQIWTRVR